MDKSAIILAGGSSNRFGQDKGLMHLTNKPLIQHVLDTIRNLVDEEIIIVSSEAQADKYIQTLKTKASILVDPNGIHTPLIGVMTGLKEAHGKYSLLLPCDVPFVSKEVISLLFDLCINKNAVIPRWANCYIEPLQAVYYTKPALEAAENALNEGKMNMKAMVDKLHGIRYVSTLVLQQLDPDLKTFFNVNTPLDLKKAEQMAKRQDSYSF